VAEPLVVEAHEGEQVAPELRPLLIRVYDLLEGPSTDLGVLKRALADLLTFLESSRGRTNANCWATDLFFGLQDGWDRDWDHLPDAFCDILSDMGGALHDTVSAPAIAADVDSTPEKLLARVQALRV